MSRRSEIAGVEIAAAEHAIGLRPRTLRRLADARTRIDPRFAQAVADWGVRLHPLLHEVRPQQPSAQVWRRIESRLGRHGGGRTGRARTGLLAGAAAAAIFALARRALRQRPREDGVHRRSIR